jgi:RNA polymerase sigma factor (sigma-70 family)
MDYTTEAILEGISMSNSDVLNYIYKKFFPAIRTFIEHNNGTEEDARDLFQEAVIVIYRKMKKEPLVLSCNFKTYIYSVCKLLWLKHLERNKDGTEIKSEGVLDNRLDETSQTYDQTERYRLYQKYFEKLSPDCKKVLQLALEKISLKDIADIMGYKSEKDAKKRKFQCKQQLIDSIKSDNEFKKV